MREFKGGCVYVLALQVCKEEFARITVWGRESDGVCVPESLR